MSNLFLAGEGSAGHCTHAVEYKKKEEPQSQFQIVLALFFYCRRTGRRMIGNYHHGLGILGAQNYGLGHAHGAGQACGLPVGDQCDAMEMFQPALRVRCVRAEPRARSTSCRLLSSCRCYQIRWLKSPVSCPKWRSRSEPWHFVSTLQSCVSDGTCLSLSRAHMGANRNARCRRSRAAQE